MKKTVFATVFMICMMELFGCSCAEQVPSVSNNISESYTCSFVAAIMSDGTVKAAGENQYGQCNVEMWENIKKIATGYNHTVGLRSDGSVIATGANEYGQCNTEQWNNIVDITADANYTIGLKNDGTIVSTGEIDKDVCQKLEQWTSVSAIFSSQAIHAICTDGGIISTLLNQKLHFTEKVKQVLSIEDTMYILTEKGKVVCVLLDEKTAFELSEAKVTQIVDDSTLLLLTSEGKVISSFDYQDSWNNIVAITANYGVTSDGTIIAAHNDELAREVCKWKVKLN